jgi:hypothetical protein
MGAAAHFALDQAGMFERLDVFGGGGERNGEGLRELADRSLAAREFAQHPAAGDVAEGVKDGIQLRRLSFNHVVEYRGRLLDSQPFG